MLYLNKTERKEVKDTMKILEMLENIGKDPNINKIFFKKFKIIKKIAEGSFGSIYEGVNIETGASIAIKLEERTKYNLLEREAYTLINLKGFGIVDIISFGRNKKYNIMVQPLLGDSLYQLFLEKKKNFFLKDIFLIGLQCLDRLEWIHAKNYIHRDIKPENFLLGRTDPRIIYLIDFGLSKKYRSERTMKHIQFCLSKKVSGTVRYASVNSLKGFEQSRRDDLESFCYMMLFFILKKLPWQGLKAKTQAGRYRKVLEKKEEFNIDEYKKIIPWEIISVFKYVKKLKFDEEPNYQMLKNLLKDFLKGINCQENEAFSWINDTKILSLKKSIDIHRRTNSLKKRILNSIQKNLNLNKFIEVKSSKNKTSEKLKQSYKIIHYDKFSYSGISGNKISLSCNNPQRKERKIIKENITDNLAEISRKALYDYTIPEIKNSLNSIVEDPVNNNQNQINKSLKEKNGNNYKYNTQNYYSLHNKKHIKKIKSNIKSKIISSNFNKQKNSFINFYGSITTEAKDTNDKLTDIKPKKIVPIFKINNFYNNQYKNNACLINKKRPLLKLENKKSIFYYPYSLYDDKNIIYKRRFNTFMNKTNDSLY